MTSLTRLLIPGVILVTAACAWNDVGVSTSFDPLSQFPTTATYSWDLAASSMPDDERLDRLDFTGTMREAVDEAFTERGYKPVASGDADYRLSYEFRVHTTYRASNTRAVGVLSLSLVDAGTGHRVWFGFGRAEIHVGLTAAERRERLLGAAQRMLKKFPPTQRGD